jgi:hypothetical protein
MTELQFLFDENLIALGRALRNFYPDEVSICGEGEAPQTASDDPEIYPWCRRTGAVLVTYDFNMLRDERVLQALIANVGIRVLWIDQVKGEPAQKAFTRIAGRWEKVRTAILSHPDSAGLVLRGNNELIFYRRIADAVYEVVRRRRPRTP